MPNEYQWAQTAGAFPETTHQAPSEAQYGSGSYESKQQSAQAPRNYQPESYSGADSQYTSPPSSSYGGQPSRSSSYTHQSGPDPSFYTQQQQQQQPPQQQQYGSNSRTSSYTSGAPPSNGAANSDLIEQSVNMQDLIRENFGGQGGSPSPSSVQLSPALLEHLQQVSPNSKDSKLYFLEPQTGGGAGSSLSGMVYPSSDLALANQLAVKHHRLACMRKLGGAGGPEQSDKILRATEWSLLDEERLELTTRLSTGTVSTTVQELSLFRRK